jgi:hypothetical protein
MTTMNPDRQYIHPEEDGNLRYWSRKWGVTDAQLHQAILNTGSLRSDVLYEQLHQHSWKHHPFREGMKALRHTVNFIF